MGSFLTEDGLVIRTCRERHKERERESRRRRGGHQMVVREQCLNRLHWRRIDFSTFPLQFVFFLPLDRSINRKYIISSFKMRITLSFSCIVHIYRRSREKAVITKKPNLNFLRMSTVRL